MTRRRDGLCEDELPDCQRSPMAHRRRSRRIVFSAFPLGLIILTILLYWLDINHHVLSPVLPLEIAPPRRPPVPPQKVHSTPTSSFSSASTSFSRPTSSSASSSASMAEPSETAAAALVPTARLVQGIYTGTTMSAAMSLPKEVDVFRGIPFAQSTGGQNRFRPPVPLRPANGSGSRVFRATTFGNCCPVDGRKMDLTQGEDCLNLNIYRPASVTAARAAADRTDPPPLLPVAIYVHGGAFNGGLGIERNMASFVGYAEDDIIGVNFNYRVGALGFLPSELTAREGILNLGLRDQQALFQWVQDNIAEFGGDKNNVTIMGLSAGAHSVGPPPLYSFLPFLRLTSARSAITSCTTPKRTRLSTRPCWSPGRPPPAPSSCPPTRGT